MEKRGVRSLKKDKKALITSFVGKLLIGLAILVILIAATIILKGKGISAFDFIKDLFRFKG